MGAEQQETTGPDLAEGIALDELGEGGIAQGHVGDDAVVVVRVEGEVYAIDAGCTHYGVPLGGGIVVGHTIRCPAHHSRFDLRTGEAVAAPALRPAGCWNVEVRDGRAYVTGKREPAPRPHAPPAAEAPRAVGIVGAGAGGAAVGGNRGRGRGGDGVRGDAAPRGVRRDGDAGRRRRRSASGPAEPV